MRKFLTFLLVAALTIPLAAQGPAPKKEEGKEKAKAAPGSLEDTLEKVLRSSPEIKAAESKVRDAETELFRVRHQMMTKVTAAFNELKIAKRLLELASDDYQQYQKQQRTKHDPALETAFKSAIEKHRGEVERLETDLKSLRGEFGIKLHSAVSDVTFTPDGRLLWSNDGTGVRVWDTSTGKLVTNGLAVDIGMPSAKAASSDSIPNIAPAMAAQIKRLLEAEIKMDGVAVPVGDVLNELVKLSGTEIPIRMLMGDGGEKQMTLSGTISGRGWLQAIEDTDPSLRIVVREYGLLFTSHDRMPPGALRVTEIGRKAAETSEKPVPKAEPKK